jgi:hypothetical protein
VVCSDCHLGGNFDTTPTDCFSCHQADFDGTTDPAHTAGLFPHDCLQCHNQTDWAQSTLDHDLTAFPLRGAHVTVTCADCHRNGQYLDNATDCWSCHEQDYGGSAEPAHAAGLFPHDCTGCHDENAWVPATLDHDATAFPLTGAHVTVSCAACHVNGQFQGTPAACWACHEPDYQGATNPNHVSNQFPQDCMTCHNTSAWQPSTFDHSATDFPLTGAHVTVSCAACHVNGQFQGTPAACWACHEPDYQNTTNPSHVSNQFPQDCIQCHNTTAWQPSTFDHGTTDFPLTGAHGTITCVACHVNGQYQGTPTDCWSCHQEEFNGVADPNHVTAQFPHDCALCHTTYAWSGATFDHNDTDFPLTGAHVTVSCAACHVDGQYQGTPTDCWSCHQDDFNAVTDPNHVSGQYPHDCAVCHTTATWAGASFNHNNTEFPLTGAHVTVSCAACHVGGQYQGTPTDCYFCHESDYNSAASPEHDGHGYPTNCAMCHSTAPGWNSNWNHAVFFPIYTGRHRNEWTTCASCHLNNDLSDFSCTHCHEHRQSEMADQHDEVSGYVWESHACLQCHPSGNGLAGPSIRWRSLDLRRKEPLR